MAIKLVWAHLADYAAPGASGKLTLVGVFERIYTRTDATEYAMPICHLAGKVEASVVDGSSHTLVFKLLDGNGHEVLEEPAQLEAEFVSAGPGYPLSSNFLLHLMGLPLPGIGDYEFEVSVNGQRLGTVPFVVAPVPG